MRDYILLAVFIVGVLGIGTLIGIKLAPGEWYASLAKPFFNPPNWIFGPVWTVLYVMIAIAGWRTVKQDTSGLQTTLWFTQMALNFLWTPVVFGLNLLWPGAVVILALAATIAGFILVARNNGDVVSSWLFAPYLAWVSFASLLNISLAVLNPAR